MSAGTEGRRHRATRRTAHRISAAGRFALFGILVLAGGATAQHDPRLQPARTYAIRGATVHTLAGQTIQNGTVVVRDGLIRAVGADVSLPQGATLIDGSGLHVYPGMVDAFSRLGLTEIGSVSATQDLNELGSFNPHLMAYTAIHPASELIPVARANGVTHALSAPGSGGGGFRGGGGSGGIAGQATLLHLDGWTVEEMAIEPSAAMVVQWPTIQTRTFDFTTFSVREKPYTEAKKEYDKRVAEMEEWFQSAAHYRQAVERGDPSKVERNLQLEQLARTIGGDLPVLVVANDKRSIEGAVEFAERHDLKLIIGGGAEAREVKEMLAEKGIPVILGATQSMPRHEDDPYYYPFSLPGELHDAGVKIAFATFNASDSRTLPYEAANAVPFGLSHDEALKAVTLAPAEILGVSDRLGTIEAGKVGNLIVTTGDPLEIQTRVEYVFIKGMPVDTDNKHRRLWEKYRKRPERLETGRATQDGGGRLER
ncbi:MAG: amidohydrolase family protein [Gemmatimonadota bacterium]